MKVNLENYFGTTAKIALISARMLVYFLTLHKKDLLTLGSIPHNARRCSRPMWTALRPSACYNSCTRNIPDDTTLPQPSKSSPWSSSYTLHNLLVCSKERKKRRNSQVELDFLMIQNTHVKVPRTSFHITSFAKISSVNNNFSMEEISYKWSETE